MSDSKERSEATSLRNRSVCVTGADGQIGSALVTSLVQRGARVRTFQGPSANPLHSMAGVVYSVRGDIDDVRKLHELVEGCELCVHLAGPSSVAASFQQPREFVRIHTLGTASLLEALRASSTIQRVVYASSAEVYGQPRVDPVNEDHPCEPRSPYGAAKLAAEHLIRVSASAEGYEALSLRFFSLYGPHPPPRSLLGTILHQCKEANVLSLANYAPVRDYCHLDDAIGAIESALVHPLSDPIRTYNIASGKGTSVRELAELVLALAERELELAAGRLDRPQEVDILRLVGDPRRAARELGWSPQVSLRTGIARLLATHGFPSTTVSSRG